MIRLNCFIKISNPANKHPMQEAATELVGHSCNDKGVIAYEAFSSLTSDDHMFICETWENEAALEAHMQTEHFKRLVGRMERLGTLTLEKFTL